MGQAKAALMERLERDLAFAEIWRLERERDLGPEPDLPDGRDAVRLSANPADAEEDDVPF